MQILYIEAFIDESASNLDDLNYCNEVNQKKNSVGPPLKQYPFPSFILLKVCNQSERPEKDSGK